MPHFNTLELYVSCAFNQSFSLLVSEITSSLPGELISYSWTTLSESFFICLLHTYNLFFYGKETIYDLEQ